MSDRALAMAKPTSMCSDCVWVSLAGVAWVVINVGLGSLGIYVDWPGTCAFFAGLVNGTLVAVAAVAAAGDRFKGGVTGLLGGMTLSAFRKDGSVVWSAMQGVHGVVDSTLQAMGIDVNEKLHDAIEQEALYMVWTMLLVVLASLLVEWMRSFRASN